MVHWYTAAFGITGSLLIMNLALITREYSLTLLKCKKKKTAHNRISDSNLISTHKNVKIILFFSYLKSPVSNLKCITPKTHFCPRSTVPSTHPLSSRESMQLAEPITTPPQPLTGVPTQ
jgi:hypothetical protein